MVRYFGDQGLPFSISDIRCAHSGGGAPAEPLGLQLLRGSTTKFEDNAETIIWTESLPYRILRESAHRAAQCAGSDVQRIIQIGDNCAAILDSLMLAIWDAGLGGESIVVCSDHFGRIAKASTSIDKEGLSEWYDAASLIHVGATGRKMSLLALANSTAPSLQGLLSLEQYGEHDVLVKDEKLEKMFSELDLSAELHVIDTVMQGQHWRRGDAVVATNRGVGRTDRLRTALSDVCPMVVTSRQSWGHTGGSDISKNLSDLFETNCHKGQKIVLSANGLGYRWSSMLLRVEG